MLLENKQRLKDVIYLAQVMQHVDAYNQLIDYTYNQLPTNQQEQFDTAMHHFHFFQDTRYISNASAQKTVEVIERLATQCPDWLW